jgi:hypothetical protein
MRLAIPSRGLDFPRLTLAILSSAFLSDAQRNHDRLRDYLVTADVRLSVILLSESPMPTSKD